MNGKALFIPFLLGGALFAAPRPTLESQEIRARLDEVNYQLNSTQVELDLLHERLSKVEKEKKTSSPLEARLSHLEKTQEAFLADLKSLQKNLNDTTRELTKCQNQLSTLEGHLSGDLKDLKKNLSSMVGLLDSSESKSYVVKPGDSLGQIALDHKVSLKALKEANNLEKDTIFVGQKLNLP